MLTSQSPISPAHMDWSSYYPAFSGEPKAIETLSSGEAIAVRKPMLKDVEVADIGCGFGGLLVALAPVLPDALLLGT